MDLQKPWIFLMTALRNKTRQAKLDLKEKLKKTCQMKSAELQG